eukprot:6689671-Alexandrium_andersonii.AAC.1
MQCAMDHRARKCYAMRMLRHAAHAQRARRAMPADAGHVHEDSSNTHTTNIPDSSMLCNSLGRVNCIA